MYSSVSSCLQCTAEFEIWTLYSAFEESFAGFTRSNTIMKSRRNVTAHKTNPFHRIQRKTLARWVRRRYTAQLKQWTERFHSFNLIILKVFWFECQQFRCSQCIAVLDIIVPWFNVIIQTYHRRNWRRERRCWKLLLRYLHNRSHLSYNSNTFTYSINTQQHSTINNYELNIQQAVHLYYCTHHWKYST